MKRINVVQTLFLVMFTSATVWGQPPPNTDIFLFDISTEGGMFTFSNPVNITDRPGYDNQPFFTSDGKSILYSSIRDDEQSDTYRYDIETGETKRVYFTTPEAEYSPTEMPGGRYYSTVRVEADGVQRLWKMPLVSGPMEVILEDVQPVGYHAWLDESTVALFILDNQEDNSPITLQLINLNDGSSKKLAENIGRSLHKIPGRRALSFIHKVSPYEWLIMEYDLDREKMQTIIYTQPNKEDLCWYPDGSILMANGSQLFKYNRRVDFEWSEIADFSANGITNITRIAVSPDGKKLAMVVGR